MLITNLSSLIISNDDDNLEIPGYDLFRVDHPPNTIRGGVCILLLLLMIYFNFGL